MSDIPSVVIIGAGASGIAAATRLFENGIDNLTILGKSKDFLGVYYLYCKIVLTNNCLISNSSSIKKKRMKKT